LEINCLQRSYFGLAHLDAIISAQPRIFFAQFGFHDVEAFFRTYRVRTKKRDFVKAIDKLSGGFQPSDGFRDDLLLQLDCRPSLIVQEDRASLRLRLSSLRPLALALSFAESNRLRLSGLADNNRQYTYENKGCQSVVFIDDLALYLPSEQ
jgi:hypothetical protein